MKHSFSFFLFISLILIVNSCGHRDIDSRIIGKWQTMETIITVREEIDKMKFEFIKDTVIATITINSDMTVNGKVGSAKIENGILTLNKNLLPANITGIAYKIECSLAGKIFKNDPLLTKKVQFWIYPIVEEDKITAELRYTEGGSQFPMAGLSFSKIKDK